MSHERLELIALTNPDYYADIVTFITENPEFIPFLPIVALSPRGKSTSNPEIMAMLKEKGIKTGLIFYACMAGVRVAYGEKIFLHVMRGEMEKLTEKKRKIITDIIEQVNEDELKSVQDIDEKLKGIKGVGDGARTFLKDVYFFDENIVYPTDRIFQKGLKRIYKLEKLGVAGAKKICNGWKGKKYIGTMFTWQAATYGQFL
jgi:hypothetical protein